jgi:alpha-glucoside transport system permease protein
VVERSALLFDSGTRFIGFSNYLWAFGDGNFRQSILNNVLWLIIVPSLPPPSGW